MKVGLHQFLTAEDGEGLKYPTTLPTSSMDGSEARGGGPTRTCGDDEMRRSKIGAAASESFNDLCCNNGLDGGD